MLNTWIDSWILGYMDLYFSEEKSLSSWWLLLSLTFSLLVSLCISRMQTSASHPQCDLTAPKTALLSSSCYFLLLFLFRVLVFFLSSILIFIISWHPTVRPRRWISFVDLSFFSSFRLRISYLADTPLLGIFCWSLSFFTFLLSYIIPCWHPIARAHRRGEGQEERGDHQFEFVWNIVTTYSFSSLVK
jgi:phosphatidylglycerophosphate synthase